MTAQPWTFGDPAGPGDQFNAKEHHHHLVAFVQPAREDVSTKFGDDEATRCRFIVCLDGGDDHEGGLVHDNALVFGNLGVAAYANGDHAIVLGRVSQSEAKPGQSPAWILDQADPADHVMAKSWFEANAGQNAAGHITIG